MKAYIILLALESKRLTHLVGHRKNNLNYYGVLDGHAGARASEFAKNDLPGRLARVHDCMHCVIIDMHNRSSCFFVHGTSSEKTE